MRFALLVSVLILGCSEQITPTPTADAGTFEDAPAPAADVSTRVDTDASTASDAFIGPSDAAPDAATQPPDASTAPDAFIVPDAVAQPPDAFAVAPDASTLPSDAVIDRCAPDAFEANESAAEATLVASGVGWAPSDYPLTWHDSDRADWVRADLDSTGVVGLFRVHASDVGSSGGAVEVRVTCRDGLTTCRGVGTSRTGSTCIGRRVGNAYADVGCVGSTPAAVSVLVGVDRGAGECTHTLSVSLQPASF